MLKVTENPNCKNDFKNIAAEHVTQFSHKLQVTDEAFYADSKRNNEISGNKPGREDYISNHKFYKNSVGIKEKKKKCFLMKSVYKCSCVGHINHLLYRVRGEFQTIMESEST